MSGFEVLRLLRASNVKISLRKGTPITKEMFLNHLYGGMDEPQMKIIDVFICKLRKKLAIASNGKDCIETIWSTSHSRPYRSSDPPYRGASRAGSRATASRGRLPTSAGASHGLTTPVRVLGRGQHCDLVI
jgi:hypothetical protein